MKNELAALRIHELKEGLRQVLADHALHSRTTNEALRTLAQDVLQLADLILPNDAREAELVRGSRQRAEKVLTSLGGEHDIH